MFKLNPSVPAFEKLKAIPIFDYQVYFQTPVSVIYIFLMFVSVTEKLQLRKQGLCFRVWQRPSWRRIWRGRSRFSFPAVVKQWVDWMYTHTPALHCAVSELNRWKNHPHVMNVFLFTTEGSSPSQHRRSVRSRWRFLLVISVCCESWRFLNRASSFTDLMLCVCFITGGLFVGLPEQIPRSSMLTEADLQYYVSQYKERGFRLQIFQLPVDCVSVCSANK